MNILLDTHALLWSIGKSKELFSYPFDRLLIYKSIKHGYMLASNDSKMKLYKDCGLAVLW